ncbi:hypothetical protein AB0A70_18840 [Streptomyces morookaense]|uniref:hypothetical protein n=1 Tax=Streptomyces morookaense TaxID=1970 RepID=UPI0033C91901
MSQATESIGSPSSQPSATPPAAADAAHYALVLTALRQAASRPADGRGAAGRAAQRGRELSDTLTAAMAQAIGETGLPGTPGELLAEAHLRLGVHHMTEYLCAAVAAAAETGEDPGKALIRAVSLVREIARRSGQSGVAE